MPVVTIEGVPSTVSALKINTVIRPGIKKAVAGAAGLNISSGDVSVFVHQENFEDSGFASTQTDIVVFVDLFDDAHRTDEVLTELAKAIVKKIKEFDFAKNSLIEVFPRPLSRKTFWSSGI